MLVSSCNLVSYLQHVQNVLVKHERVSKCLLDMMFFPLCAFLAMNPSVFDVLPFSLSLVGIKMPPTLKQQICSRIFGICIY